MGSQNDQRYAYFPDSRRLLITRNGETRIYDAGEHRISGVSQQQSSDQSLTFTSQLGPVRIEDLPLVSTPSESDAAPSPQTSPAPTPSSNDDQKPGPQPENHAIVAMIERLADLRQKNILTEEEFVAKKRELLSRL